MKILIYIMILFRYVNSIFKYKQNVHI